MTGGLDFLLGGGKPEDTWVEPARGMALEMGAGDRAQRLGGRDAVPLQDGGVWLVLTGEVNVFLLRGDEPEAATRHHIATVPAGGILLGVTGAGPDNPMIGVPASGTTLVAIDRDAVIGLLRTAAQVPPDAEGEAATAAHQRIEGLSATLLEYFRHGVSAVPYTAHVLAPGETREIAEAGEIVVGGRRPAWLRAPVSRLRVNDLIDLVPDPDTRLLACAGLWFEVPEPCALESIDVRAWLSEGDVSRDLDAMLAMLASLSAARISAELKDERDRLHRAGEVDDANFSASLLGLVAVLRRRREMSVGVGRTPLGMALARVIANEGGTFDVAPQREALLTEGSDPLAAFAEAAGVHTRMVELRDKWWEADHGSLVGFRGEDDEPVALLPRRGGGYDMLASDSDRPVRVTAANAPSFGSHGWFIFQPLPAGKLTARRLIGFGLRGQGRDVWIIAWMVVLSGLLSLASPVITGWIIDPVIPEAQTYELYVLTAILIAAGFASAGFGLVQALSMLRVEGAMDYRVQAAVWDRLLKLEAGFFRGHSVGDLANRAASINSMRRMLTGSVTSTLIHGVIGLFSLGLMTYYDWHLTLATVIVAAIYAVIAFFIGRSVLARNREMLALTGKIQALVLQLLSGIRKIRIAGAERRAFEQWAQRFAELTGLSYRQYNLNNALIVFKAAFNVIAVAGILVVLAWQGGVLFAIFDTPTSWSGINTYPLTSVMNSADFVSFNVAFGQFLGAVFGVTGIAIQLLNLKPLYERVQPILEAELERAVDADDPGRIQGAVELRDVVFGYDKTVPVLKGLSLHARPGEFIAIVGTSGAGKSTIVRLLLGFDTPDAGSVFIDNKDLAHLDRHAVRRQFGTVLQNGRVLAGSIQDNIAAGANVTRDDVLEAARLAGLAEDIEAMPMGLQTFLNEGAGTLSGGQRQRLMIARALVRRPRLVIFDEATSALDNRLQAVVSESVNALNCTRVVIAHRLSTIIEADRIYVLDRGEVAESGTYTELMERGGVFAALARRQLA